MKNELRLLEDFTLKKESCKRDKTTQWVEACVTKSECLSSIPGLIW